MLFRSRRCSRNGFSTGTETEGASAVGSGNITRPSCTKPPSIQRGETWLTSPRGVHHRTARNVGELAGSEGGQLGKGLLLSWFHGWLSTLNDSGFLPGGVNHRTPATWASWAGAGEGACFLPGAIYHRAAASDLSKLARGKRRQQGAVFFWAGFMPY